MNTHVAVPPTVGRVPGRNPRPARPLVTFAAVALPVGWVLLSVPLVVDVPLEPFVLATLLLGLVLPVVLLARREGSSVRSLFRDVIRLPQPLWLLVPAALLIPVAVGAAGALAGGPALTGSFLARLAVANVLSSLLIVNLWEELVWAGFVQRRVTGRRGLLTGGVVTALLFTGIHLPLSLYGADGVGDVAFNIAAMIVSGVGLRLLIGAFDVWGHGSILALGLLHATFNASAELLDPGFAWIRYVVTLALGLAAYAIVVRAKAVAR